MHASTDGNILDKAFALSIGRDKYFIIQIEQWKFLCGESGTHEYIIK